MTRKEYYHNYYINHISERTAYFRKRQSKKSGNTYKPRAYKGRKGFILCNESETLYFQNAKEISRHFNMNYNTVMSRIYKNKKKKNIEGYEVDFAI